MSYVKFRTIGDNIALFGCPGCEDTHYIRTDVWEWDGDIYSPTVTPSILVQSGNAQGPTVCHSYVKEGMIQFLSDSTHHLAGQTVPIPPILYGKAKV